MPSSSHPLSCPTTNHYFLWPAKPPTVTEWAGRPIPLSGGRSIMRMDHLAKEEETMLRMWTALETRFTDEEGASLVEYALLVALIAIVALLAITAVGSSVSSNFQDIADTL